VTASGVAHMQGAALVAEANVKIAKRDALPLDVQGANVGTVYGQFGIKATTSADRTTSLDVDVPSLHVELPGSSTRSVQDLDAPPPEMHVGVYVSPERFLVLPTDGAGLAEMQDANRAPPPTPTTVAVHLGRDVEIRRGTDLRVTLDGNITAKLEQKVQMNGQIRLLGGKLEVQAKSFEIQTGTVTFLGDPSNPMVNVTAGWTAEDGTKVIADYTGPLKTGKVTLRSEPALPQNEIVALVLFGTADGSQATPYATAQPAIATKAGTAVGGFATADLNRGLDKLTGLDITTKVDTSHANARPEVRVQVARDISLQLAFVLGTPPPGTNPDTTFVTINWRFLRAWSLETTLGNLGSSIANIVWQRRY
jgi:translocation and assembly module TamB